MGLLFVTMRLPVSEVYLVLGPDKKWQSRT